LKFDTQAEFAVFFFLSDRLIDTHLQPINCSDGIEKHCCRQGDVYHGSCGNERGSYMYKPFSLDIIIITKYIYIAQDREKLQMRK